MPEVRIDESLDMLFKGHDFTDPWRDSDSLVMHHGGMGGICERSGEYSTEVKKDRHEPYLARVGLLPKALPGIVDGKRELTGPRSVNILVLNILAP